MRISRLWRFIKPYRYLLSGASVCLVLFTLSGLLMPLILKIIIDRTLGSSDMNQLYALLALVLLIYGVRQVFFYISHYLTFYAAQRVLFDVRTKLFKHLQSLSLRFYEDYRTGKLISNVITDVAMLQQMIGGGLINLIVNMFMMVFILGVLVFMNPKLSMICLALVPLQLLNFLYFKHDITLATKELREKMSEISGGLAETINGVKVVKSFAREKTENRGFAAQLRPAFSMSFNINMKSVRCHILSESTNIISRVLMLGMGGAMVARSEMSVGEFVAYFSYMGMLVGPIMQLSALSQMLSQGIAGGTRIFKLLDTVPEVKEPKSAKDLSTMAGDVEFKNVNFAYNGKSILRDFNLKIKPGQKVALVGPSGSGKSTIANLLLRFYDVGSGEINIDGRNIKGIRSSSFLKHVGVVLQEPFLFSGSIAENIRYGRQEANDDEVFEAAKKANLHDFIKDLEDGYDTEVGENGVALSGGQKQRVAIARAVLKNPKLLILDEATSALDTVSEYHVQDALDKLMDNKTTIIIAHRLSTIRNADVIVVLENGSVSQIGEHRQLLSQEGVYRDLYQNQRSMENRLSGLNQDEVTSAPNFPDYQLNFNN